MTRFPLFHRLRSDRRGATIIEFAIVAPVMALMMMGLGDVLYQVYAQSILDGAVQKAGRDSGIEGGAATTTALDDAVLAMVKKLAKNATYVSTRKSYSTFSNIKPEAFTDTNGNGIRDAKECFTDVNGNKTWDADPGLVGQGGANDVTLYTMTLTYPRVFPVMRMLGGSATQTITSKTLLKNQPYNTQSVVTAATVCT